MKQAIGYGAQRQTAEGFASHSLGIILGPYQPCRPARLGVLFIITPVVGTTIATLFAVRLSKIFFLIQNHTKPTPSLALVPAETNNMVPPVFFKPLRCCLTI
jgi:hypothetical protein